MAWSNQTMVNEFILLGFSSLGQLQILLFVVFLVFYVVTVIGNFLIILVISMDNTLHCPMYFFLQNLSFAEAGFISAIVPKMLVNLLSKNKAITLLGCRAQIYFVFFFGAMECYILIVMAYDRFVAICNPLRYTIIMNRKICVLLVAAVWTSGFPIGTIQSTWLLSFPFCGSNEISHFFCDAPPVLYLACADTYRFELFSLIGTFINLLCPFILILVSYICIIRTILKMPSIEGRRKAFSTCSSHIIVVTLFYGSASLTHFRPKASYSSGNNHLLSLSYVIVTPMLNPIIYSLRNKEMKKALSRLLSRTICF
ncbi:olfactory receptor 10A4-like [Hemicordylus capensis]|uniref:olfactory receptor 10A4-like n=1 Tax=Hemicordylus capensis TaxID=884348 RepID=UPI002303B344|nr:olfactory receptor 10A4-like [Hemicordylus capensis]